MRLVWIAACLGALGCSDGGAQLAGSGGAGGAGGSGGSGASPAGGSGGSGGDLPTGRGVGQACSHSEPCRAGLRCEAEQCEPAAETPLGSPCLIAGECEPGLQCLAGVCAEGGEGAESAPCDTDLDCERGLRCGVVGFGLQCIPQGNVDVGGACQGSAECLAGLTCLEGRCLTAPPGVPSFGLPSAPEIECEPPSSGAVRAYFEVPGASPAGLEGDFFRLPFPNDARLTAGRPDLSGFPTPGVSLLPFDPVALYASRVEQEAGWGMNPVVTFRFSGPIDFETFREASDLSVRPVRWVDITAGDPAYGSQAGLRWYYSEGGGKYICRDWFAIRRSARAPLTPGHTYAVFLTTHGRAQNGTPIQRSEHLVSLLADTAPADPKLAAVHAAYAPFRAYLTEQGIPTDQVLNASVITVGDNRGPMERLAAAVQAEPAPTASSWVRCGAGVASPCPDSTGDRACEAATSSYDEYHALVSLPVYQAGEAPYEAAGGAIQASPVRQEQVCLSLTVPKRAAPAAGYPLVVFAHGTGGHFRSHVRPEVAGALADYAGGVAVLGVDQVAHGPRRGASTQSSETLFFNFANPDAARGNVLQGAADQLALARFAAALDLSAAQSGGEAIRIDPGAIVFFGHSQGATHGSLALPYSAIYRAGVLSGNGAILRDSLMEKRQPVNISAAIPFLLGDLDSSRRLPGGTNHPVMNLIQHFIEPADPINFAALVGRTPPPGVLPKHLFVTYGLSDSYSPNVTLANYIQAAQVDLAAAHVSVITPDDIGLTSEPVPLSHTDVVGGVELTLAARQYQPPAGRDGHFVVFDVAGATQDVVRFLGMAAAGEVPVVGP